MMPATLQRPIYFRVAPKKPVPASEPEHDFEALRKLLLPYDSNVSLEKAKEIGSFLLRINALVNKPEIQTNNLEGDYDEQSNK